MTQYYAMLVNLALILCSVTGLHGLSLWIDRKQVKEFMGASLNIDIPVIENDEVTTLLLNPDIEQYLPVINSSVNIVNLTWEAGPDHKRYRYWFTELKSMEPDIMYDPLLSIPTPGYVPFKETVFQMAIPCTGRKTGIAPFIIVLHISDRYDRPLHGFPIKLHFRKHCKAYSQKTCDMKCLNGGRCNMFGVCDCKPNYFGKYCELTDCVCRNNATCDVNKKCVCRPGYTGEYCQQATCDSGCANGGHCIAPNKCWCPRGYEGDLCLHKSCPFHCENGGKCVNSKCECPSGYGGHVCQKDLCSQSCGDHGFCVGIDKCDCLPGWHGKYCRTSFSYGLKRLKNGKHNRTWRKRNRKRKRLLRKKRTHKKHKSKRKSKSRV